MSLFGLFNNYDKPGPGVSKDEPRKSAPVRFFEILLRKFSKLIQLNLIYMIPMAIAAIIMYGISTLPIQHIAYSSETFGTIDLYSVYFMPLPLAFMGPFNCGMAFITRNFAREEHAFVWSDFWDAVKDNWKAGLLNSIITYVAVVVLSFGFMFYWNQWKTQGFFYVIPLIFIGLIFAIMLFSQYYIPVMIVTFNLKLRHIYRNAVIFSIMGVVRNILITFVFVAMLIALWFCPGKLLFVPLFLFVIILCSFISYLCSFATYSLIDGFMIQPYYKQEAAANAPVRTEDDIDIDLGSDDTDDEEDDGPQYVYVNGRLIEKSKLNNDN